MTALRSYGRIFFFFSAADILSLLAHSLPSGFAATHKKSDPIRPRPRQKTEKLDFLLWQL